ncbi:hypothetical protein FHQ18_00695 [Deferribacter autotrophicus]|uniref:Alpha/beta hydrolase n=1 Tax=Deferribacter autotrophicus TaxID=500465 RepID=A0A5A8F7M1_9BACT|nr:hypothetical protein [Deferribacter autotrophicus]KAA0259429.1 hypothetical protein FHQ18_00695 [Deferribacter autotrophicus]
MFKNTLYEEYMKFLKNYFKVYYDCDINYADLIVGWGSGCFALLENIKKLNNKAIVLISPYLDFDMFFNWVHKDDDWKRKYLYLSGIDEERFLKVDADYSMLTNKKVFLPEMDVYNSKVYIIYGDENKLVPVDYGLKLGLLLNGTSFHLIEGAGFAPFYDKHEEFKKIVEEFVINENF